MASLSERFLKIYEEHRQKVAAVEQETAYRIVQLLDELEGASAETPAVKPKAKKSARGDDAATRVDTRTLADLESLPASGFVPRTDRKVEVIRADITNLEVDAIVNPASRTVSGGGGVEGSIYSAGGAELVKACRALGGCDRGQAKITRGFDLPAKHVIHTVGPIWKGGDAGEGDVLASCYRNSLQLALDNKLRSVAFPAISTGNFSYPVKEAAKVAVAETTKFVNSHVGIEKVYLVCWDDTALTAFNEALASAQ